MQNLVLLLLFFCDRESFSNAVKDSFASVGAFADSVCSIVFLRYRENVKRKYFMNPSVESILLISSSPSLLYRINLFMISRKTKSKEKKSFEYK